MTRFSLYGGAAYGVFLALLIAVLVARQGLRGLPLWPPGATRYALQTFAPAVVISLMGLPIDAVLRRKEWWAHGIAGALVGPPWAFVIGLKSPSLEQAAIGATIFVLLGRWAARRSPADAAPVRAASESPPQVSEQDFIEWGRAWDAARRRVGWRITGTALGTGAAIALLNAMLFSRFMSPGRSALLMLAMIGIVGAIGGRIAVARQRRLVRELGRLCSACRALIENPRAVMRAGGKCLSCGAALYASGARPAT